jgi:bifunctional DNA-binding transcriptional regulator/antitoxin component of YhaV-PrlF toxin-antitoxin module
MGFVKPVKKGIAKKSAARKRVANKSYASSSSLLRNSVARKPTLIHMNAQGRVTLPASARRRLGLEGDADLQLDVERRAIVLKPTLVLPVEDAWAYTTRHRELLTRAHADSREGRVRSLSENELDSRP